MKKRSIFIILLISVLLMLSFGCFPNPGRSTTVQPILKTLNLLYGDISINSAEIYSVSFDVTNSMSDARVKGSFQVSGGSGNDIIALILDDTNYYKYINGNQASIFYNSGQSTASNIDVLISTPGKYWLVFDNTFSLLLSKDIETQVNLQWYPIVSVRPAGNKPQPKYDTGFVPYKPAPLNYDVKKTIDIPIEDVDPQNSIFDLTVRTTDILRGDSAWEKLKNITGNQPAPEGYEYILLKVKITLEREAPYTGNNGIFDYILKPTDFTAYSADESHYDYTQNVKSPEPQMYFEMKNGGTTEGWVVVMVDRNDTAPYLLFTKDNMYFALY